MAVVAVPKVKILRALREGPLHGYALYNETGVSLGSMYRHLRALEKEGFIRGEVRGKQKVYNITAKGRKLLDALE